MTTAIVLINAERTKINSVGEQLASIEGISEVYSVTGRFDLIAIIRLSSNEDLAELITSKITKVEGIISTESMIALKTLSMRDIASMFDLGN
ncbi:MAG: Lrp/AsnC ligand binding domain-containing protein [Bacteroidota bacterium]|jgi:Transcriptional regulators|nr:Lrp/AsnC ligand binding domain-containing protein [Bacteroidota bacterium]